MKDGVINWLKDIALTFCIVACGLALGALLLSVLTPWAQNMGWGSEIVAIGIFLVIAVALGLWFDMRNRRRRNQKDSVATPMSGRDRG